MSPEAQKEVLKHHLHLEQVPLTLPELMELRQQFQERSWHLLLRYLQPLERLLTSRIWDTKSDERTTQFVRGEYRTLKTLQRLPEEVDRIIKEKAEEEERKRKEDVNYGRTPE